MNENFEKYIEGLSPELQEKARACKTTEELNAFIAENDLELPEEALELVSGGCGTSHCNHNFVKTEEISMMPVLEINGPVGNAIYYNGVQVENIMTKQCSKCAETHYYVLTLPTEHTYSQQFGIARGYTEVSAADYNSLKAQKTW